ncbi:hypothetical protein H0H93_013226, partial [Arthromyces matolae]
MADNTARDDQIFAAQTLSVHLTQLQYNHSFVGGLALAILGSPRATEDVDVLVEVTAPAVKEMRDKVAARDPQFLSQVLKFSFLKNGNDPQRRVLIETLRTNNMGLPTVAGPSIIVHG